MPRYSLLRRINVRKTNYERPMDFLSDCYYKDEGNREQQRVVFVLSDYLERVESQAHK